MTVKVSIPFGDHIALAGLLDLPDNNAYPIVLLLHGFTGWKEEEHLESLARALCARGIGSLRYDAPGFGESEGSLVDDYRLSNYLSSVQSAYKFIRREMPSARNVMGIWGHSLGGFVAIESSIRLGYFNAVCASQSSIGKPRYTEEFVLAWQRTGRATFPDERVSSTLELPYDFYLDRTQYDVFQTIGNLKAPLLLIAGTSDTVAPVSQVMSIYEAAPEPKTYREFPTNHFYKFDSAQLAAINDVTVEFFAAHLLS